MQIFDLCDIPESAIISVGGKARGLNMLTKAGLNIAEGFVIESISDRNDIYEVSDFYSKNNLGEVAVRSSAISEDDNDFSYAGQFHSFLNVSGKENVVEAVCKCLDSLQNVNASRYAGFFSQDSKNKMSVIIQKMIKAEKAGVCFTSDPVEGGNQVLIEAVQGLGEQLVSGSVKAKQYRISSDRELNKSHSEDGLLSHEEIIRIKDEALLACSYIGVHLDMEWAIDGEGELYWLQARPITTNGAPDISELDVKLDVSDDFITNCNISEMLPGAVTPLSLSTSVNSIDYGMRKMLVETGVYRKMEDIPPTSCIVSAGGHLFINLSTLYEMENYILGASSDAVDLSLCGKVLENVEKNRNKKSSIFIRLKNAFKYFKMFSSKDKASLKIEKIAQDFKININTKDSPGELFYKIDSSISVLDESFWLHYITSSHSGAMASALFMMLNKDVKDNEKSRSIIASVLEDIDDIESVDILRSLRGLAGEILAENPSAAFLSSEDIVEFLRDSSEHLDSLNTGEALNTPESSNFLKSTELQKSSGKIKEAFDSFIKRHGHRSIREAEIRSKSWHNDLAGLADYLKAVLMSGEVAENKKDNTANQNITDLCERYGAVKRKILMYLIGQARIGVKNREFSKSMCIKILDKFKIAYAALAVQMVKNGLLPDEDLIYFFQHDEIGRLINGNESVLIKKALLRRRIFPEMKQLRFSQIYHGKPVPVTIENIETGSGIVLEGSPASRGIAMGRARVVKTIEDANMLEKGEIMIASFTDIGWSPYYCLIGALVTEIGSVLSHGVVVAREYALPLVANVEEATRIIKTGDKVFVDGTAGKVMVLESA